MGHSPVSLRKKCAKRREKCEKRSKKCAKCAKNAQKFAKNHLFLSPPQIFRSRFGREAPADLDRRGGGREIDNKVGDKAVEKKKELC